MKSDVKFEIIEHTADAAIKAYGAGLEDLFSHAAEGLYALALPYYPELAGQRRSLKLNADSPEELLVSFLNELNFFLLVQRRLLFPFEDLQIKRSAGKYHLSCQAFETELSSDLMKRMQEIKAVTYHQLKIEKDDYGYRVTVIFDL